MSTIKAKGMATAVGIIVSILYCCFSYAVKDIKSDNEFYRKLQQNPFTVALFYTDDKNDRTWHKNMEAQRRNFKIISSEGLYRNGDVQFIEADVNRRYLSSIKDDFNISTIPSLLLFNYGKVVRSDDNRIARLYGKKSRFLSPGAMKNFINYYLRDDIEDYIEENTERKVEDRILRDYSGYITYGAGFQSWPYWGAGYYGPYGGYYGGPGVGFGVTVGF